MSVGLDLPDFPWDRLKPAAAHAARHPDGAIDLSVGTPVDPVPAVIASALAASAQAPGYPPAAGTPDLQASVRAWARRRLGVDVAGVLPSIGSKEMVAGIALLLGLGPADTVIIPTLAYPTYEVGARVVGARVVRADAPDDFGDQGSLVWVNSPSNPTGAIKSAAQLSAILDWARERGALVVSDECYLELSDAQSILTVSGPDQAGVLALHSLSKRSNLAGYRCGVTLGDASVIDVLLQARRHLGAMVATPIQAAAAAAFADDDHVRVIFDTYAERRSALTPALVNAGFAIAADLAGIYIWATREQDCWETVGWFADRGVIVTPGDFYGRTGSRHVRISLTSHRIDEAARRVLA